MGSREGENVRWNKETGRQTQMEKWEANTNGKVWGKQVNKRGSRNETGKEIKVITNSKASNEENIACRMHIYSLRTFRLSSNHHQLMMKLNANCKSVKAEKLTDESCPITWADWSMSVWGKIWSETPRCFGSGINTLFRLFTQTSAKYILQKSDKQFWGS